MAGSRRSVVAFSTLAVVLVLGAGAGARPTLAQESAPPVDSLDPISPALVTVDSASLAEERPTLDTILAAIQRARDEKRGHGLFEALGPQALSLRGAVLMALRRNLDIRRTDLTRKVAEEAVLEAAAVFDPLFAVTGAGTRIRTKDRKDFAERHKTGTEVINGLNQVELHSGPIDALIYNAPRPVGYYRDEVEASTSSGSGPEKVVTMDLDVVQVLPWGQSMALNLEVKHEAKFAANNSGAAERESFYNYKRPWVTSFTSTFATPLPFTRDFGPLNSSNVAEGLSEMATINARRALQAMIETVLYRVDVAYWDLVGRAERYRAAVEVRATGSELAERTNRMAAVGLVTRSDQAQVESLMESMRGAEEQAFLDYIQASNALWRLLGLDEPALLIPTGYLALIDTRPHLPDDSGIVLGNPSHLAAMVSVRMATLTLEGAENQALPVLSVSASANAQQTNSVFGYDEVWQSLAEVGNPDTLSLSFSATFQRALGNRQALAAIESARHSLTVQDLQQRKIVRELIREFEDAHIALESALARVEITRNNRDLARSVYDRALRYQQERQVTEYQIAANLRSLLERKMDFVAARVAVKQAQAGVLAAAGLLAEQYGEYTAQTEADRVRLDTLAKTQDLNHFAVGQGERP